MIQRVQFIEGSDSRNELLSDVYLVASPKRFSPHFHGQAKGLLLGPKNFDGHAKLLSFKIQIFIPICIDMGETKEISFQIFHNHILTKGI